MTANWDLILRHCSPWNRTHIEAVHIKMLERAYLGAAILPRSVLAFWNSAAPAKKYALVISEMYAIHTLVVPFRQVGVTYMRNLHFYYQVTRHAPPVILLFEWKIFTFSACACCVKNINFCFSWFFFLIKLWIELVQVQICDIQSMGVLVSNLSSL